MRRYLLLSLLCAHGLLAADFVPQRILLRWDDASSPLDRELTLKTLDAVAEKELCPQLAIWQIALPANLSVPGACELLRQEEIVRWAQPDHYLSQRQVFPDDTQFDSQWSLHNTSSNPGTEDADIDAPEAWTLGQDSLNALGQQIVACVVDDGFAMQHPDLQPNLWQNTAEIPDNDIDDDLNGYVDDVCGWDVYSGDGELPSSGHGTHVSGIAVARGNNANQISGVCWKVPLLPIAGSSTQTSTAVAAYTYALTQKQRWLDTDGVQGANVVAINSSFGYNFGDCSSEDFSAWNDMFDTLGQLGILSVASTMNTHANVDVTGDVPTSCSSDWMISCTNTTNQDVLANNAAYGATTIDIGAPGTAVLSTYPPANTVHLSGTSMSSPHVTGSIAFLHTVASREFCDAFMQDPAATALELKQIILDSVDELPSLVGTTVSGGRLNLARAAMAISHYGQQSGPLGPLRMHYNAAQTQLEFHWSPDSLAQMYRLEQAAQAYGPWSTMAETIDTTYVLPHRNQQGFYRLITILPEE